MLSEIIKLLELRGFTPDEAKKTFDRWYAWLNNTLIKKDIKKHFNAIEESEYDQLIVIKDIDVPLVCPHHLLPVIMKVHIGYVPDGKILGLSKFARVAKDLARPLTQEEYTKLLVESIQNNLSPKFVMAIAVGQHMCMRVRGVESINSTTVTNCLRHENIENSEIKSYKEELMRVVKIDA